MSEDHPEGAPEQAPDEVVDVTNEATDAHGSTPELPTMLDDNDVQRDESELPTETERLPPVVASPPTPPAPAAQPPMPPPQAQWVGPAPATDMTMPYAGAPFQAQRAPHLIIGPALSVFGMLMWTFVVAGQFTTSWMSGAPLGEGAALAMVFFGTLGAWFFAVRRSQVVPVSGRRELVGRTLAIGVIGFLLFVGCVVVAIVVGGVSSQNHDVLIALVLLVLAAAAAIAGPRITAPVRPTRTNSQQLASVALWIGAAIVSAIAFAELAANG